MSFLTPKIYKLHHRILVELSTPVIRQLSNTHIEDHKELFYPIKEMADKLGVTELDIYKACGLLEKNQDITFHSDHRGKLLVPWSNISTSLFDRKYLSEGAALTIARLKDYLTLSLGLITIIGAFYTAYTAIKTERKNKADINNMQAKIDTIQAQIKRAGLK